MAGHLGQDGQTDPTTALLANYLVRCEALLSKMSRVPAKCLQRETASLHVIITDYGRTIRKNCNRCSRTITEIQTRTLVHTGCMWLCHPTPRSYLLEEVYSTHSRWGASKLFSRHRPRNQLHLSTTTRIVPNDRSKAYQDHTIPPTDRWICWTVQPDSETDVTMKGRDWNKLVPYVLFAYRWEMHRHQLDLVLLNWSMDETSEDHWMCWKKAGYNRIQRRMT